MQPRTARIARPEGVRNTSAVVIDPAPWTFFGAPSAALEDLDVQVAFLGVPYDGGTPRSRSQRAAR